MRKKFLAGMSRILNAPYGRRNALCVLRLVGVLAFVNVGAATGAVTGAPSGTRTGDVAPPPKKAPRESVTKIALEGSPTSPSPALPQARAVTKEQVFLDSEKNTSPRSVSPERSSPELSSTPQATTLPDSPQQGKTYVFDGRDFLTPAFVHPTPFASAVLMQDAPSSGQDSPALPADETEKKHNQLESRFSKWILQYQSLLSGALAVFAALFAVLFYGLIQWRSHRQRVRSVAAALHGELSAARAICDSRLRKKPSPHEDVVWPPLRSTVFDAYVGQIGLLGSSIARRVAVIYGQIHDRAAWHQTSSDPRSLEPEHRQNQAESSPRDALWRMIRYLDDVLPDLARLHGLRSEQQTRPPLLLRNAPRARSKLVALPSDRSRTSSALEKPLDAPQAQQNQGVPDHWNAHQTSSRHALLHKALTFMMHQRKKNRQGTVRAPIKSVHDAEDVFDDEQPLSEEDLARMLQFESIESDKKSA